MRSECLAPSVDRHVGVRVCWRYWSWAVVGHFVAHVWRHGHAIVNGIHVVAVRRLAL